MLAPVRFAGDILNTDNHVDGPTVNQVTAEMLRRLDLLIVDSPTRGFRPTETISNLPRMLPKNYLDGV
jgi:hypothetical protein